MKYKGKDIAEISITLIIILNFLIIFSKIRNIELLYILIFLFLNVYIIIFIGDTKEKYLMKKKILKVNKIMFIGINTLIFFYIFKEPYFFLSKNKILILLGNIFIGYSSLIFIQKIKLSLNLFKEIIKIFFISGLIYYLPIILFI